MPILLTSDQIAELQSLVATANAGDPKDAAAFSKIADARRPRGCAARAIFPTLQATCCESCWRIMA